MSTIGHGPVDIFPLIWGPWRWATCSCRASVLWFVWHRDGPSSLSDQASAVANCALSSLSTCKLHQWSILDVSSSKEGQIQNHISFLRASSDFENCQRERLQCGLGAGSSSLPHWKFFLLMYNQNFSYCNLWLLPLVPPVMPALSSMPEDSYKILLSFFFSRFDKLSSLHHSYVRCSSPVCGLHWLFSSLPISLDAKIDHTASPL